MRSKIILVSPVPPPITGYALITLRLHNEIKKKFPEVTVEILDTSPGSLTRKLSYHLTRLLKFFKNACTIIMSIHKKNTCAILGVDGGIGNIYVIAISLLSRLALNRVILYHHTSWCMFKKSVIHQLLFYISGQRALHIVATRQMSDKLKTLYNIQNVRIVSNFSYLTDLPLLQNQPDRPMTIGLLSNLSRGKGLDLAIDTCCFVNGLGVKCRLILAGPLENSESISIYQDGLCKLGSLLEWRGPVNDDEKRKFFNDIDVFVFPTRLSETQSLVIPEAMMSGKPCIALNRGMLNDALTNGILIDKECDFVRKSAAYIVDWDREPNKLELAGKQNRAAFELMHFEAKKGLSSFLDEVVFDKLSDN